MKKKNKKQKKARKDNIRIGLVSLFNGISTSMGYLILKLSLWENSIRSI